MNELKSAILTLLANGPMSIQAIVDALPDENIGKIGKALSHLAKGNEVAWNENHEVVIGAGE